MAASEQVTGPVAIWVSVPVITRVAADGSSQNFVGPPPPITTVTTTPLFFGWGESAPEPEFMPEYENVMSDLRGSRKPHDKLYEGQDARVTATMTIWDELVLQAMMAFTKSNNPGVDGGSDIGTLMNAEKRSFMLWLVYPYAFTKSFMAAANMRGGYRFYGAMLDGPIRRSQGTKVNKVLLSWYCSAVLVAAANVPVAYVCYDGNMNDIIGRPTTINRP